MTPPLGRVSPEAVEAAAKAIARLDGTGVGLPEPYTDTYRGFAFAALEAAISSEVAQAVEEATEKSAYEQSMREMPR